MACSPQRLHLVLLRTSDIEQQKRTPGTSGNYIKGTLNWLETSGLASFPLKDYCKSFSAHKILKKLIVTGLCESAENRLSCTVVDQS